MPRRKSVKHISRSRRRNPLRKTLKRKQLRKNSKRVNRRSSRKMRGGAKETNIKKKRKNRIQGAAGAGAGAEAEGAAGAGAGAEGAAAAGAPAGPLAAPAVAAGAEVLQGGDDINSIQDFITAMMLIITDWINYERFGEDIINEIQVRLQGNLDVVLARIHEMEEENLIQEIFRAIDIAVQPQGVSNESYQNLRRRIHDRFSNQ